MSCFLSRRVFNQMVASAALFMNGQMFMPSSALAVSEALSGHRKPYKGPNVIIIRYGGGVRRKETIDPQYSYSPFMMNVLAPKATLFNNMSIEEIEDNNTSHAQGTVNILTGKYKAYHHQERRGLSELLLPTSPTLFEMFRKVYDVDVHEAIIVSGEDRFEEEGVMFGMDHNYGLDYRSEVLSYDKYRSYVLQKKLAEGGVTDEVQETLQTELNDIKEKSPSFSAPEKYPKQVQKFWNRWRNYYGDEGYKHPRGDRLSTEVALWAMRYLKPKLMMVNYQDPDMVHWGIKSHYTRAISVIDKGIHQLVKATEIDPFYRDNTVFVIVPDCGRDDNALMSVPFQHHFNTKSSHEVFAMLYGPGIGRGQLVDKAVDQTSVTSTVAALMGFDAPSVDGRVLEEAIT